MMIGMKSFALLCLASVAVVTANHSSSSSSSSSADDASEMLHAQDLFFQWTEEFEKTYKSASEKAQRMKIWIDNHCE